jgi:hypothetical protein
MQRPIHIARHARPEAVTAVSGLGPSCAVEAGTPREGFALAGVGKGARGTKLGLGTPEIPRQFSGSIWQDRRERNRQRGRIVARP